MARDGRAVVKTRSTSALSMNASDMFGEVSCLEHSIPIAEEYSSPIALEYSAPIALQHRGTG